jgi:hypothetical protein
VEYPTKQSSWGRAKQDTISAQKTARFIWVGQAVLAVAGGTWLAQIAPLGASTAEIAGRSVIGGLCGLFVAVILIFAWNLFRAPYRQRDEARKKLSQTPLKVDFYGYKRSLVGKNWLQEDQYIWIFPVGLTNTSDKDNVGTRAVSLLLNFNAPDGKLRRFPLLLIPEKDKDKYGHQQGERGRPLAENEYLRPHEPLTGFYQFLEEGMAHFGIDTKKTWPTPILQDSLDNVHSREFKGLSAILSSSDKEDSQTK